MATAFLLTISCAAMMVHNKSEWLGFKNKKFGKSSHAIKLSCGHKFIAGCVGSVVILVNNVSAISLTPTEQTEPKRFDLMMDIEVHGTFFMCKACIPCLLPIAPAIFY